MTQLVMEHERTPALSITSINIVPRVKRREEILQFTPAQLEALIEQRIAERTATAPIEKRAKETDLHAQNVISQVDSLSASLLK